MGVSADFSSIPNLSEELFGLLSQIPEGRVTTYGDLAQALGTSMAARWVGEFTRAHEHAKDCPCYRVVSRTGELGSFVTGSLSEKQEKLEREGVEVQNGRVDLKKYRFRRFKSDIPLARLQTLQKRIAESVVLTPLKKVPEYVAGVDLSYVSYNEAVAAYVLVETATGRMVWSKTKSREVNFPYIPTLLSFREIPLLMELLEEVEAEQGRPELVFVDGSGVLHHRRAGIATHLGVVANLPTIGISKKLLCGQVDIEGMGADEPRPVVFEKKVLGMALKSKKNFRPIFICPGQKIDVEGALRMVRMLLHGHKLPEPTYLADRLSRRVAQEMRKSGKSM